MSYVILQCNRVVNRANPYCMYCTVFQARIAELEKLQPQVEDLCSQTERLATEPGAPDTVRPSVTALASRHSTTIQELKTWQQDITTGIHFQIAAFTLHSHNIQRMSLQPAIWGNLGFWKLGVELFYPSYKYREMKSLLEKEQHILKGLHLKGIFQPTMSLFIHPHVMPTHMTLFILSNTEEEILKDVQSALSIL